MPPDEVGSAAYVREGDLGLRRVYLSKSEWMYEVLPEHIGVEVRSDGISTYVYDGQQVYSDIDRPVEAGWWTPDGRSEVDVFEAPGEYFQLGEEIQVDVFGRRWLLIDVDLAALANKVAEYDKQVLEDFGLEPESGGEDQTAGGTDTEDVGAAQWLEPMSWTVITCGGVESVFNHSNDPIGAVSAPMNARERKVVLIYHNGYPTCSGTLVDQNSVLTAAHCITNGSGVKYPVSEIDVCSMENLDQNTTGGDEAMCLPALETFKSPGWTGESDAVEDYAVINMAPLADFGVGYMAMSSAADSAYNSETDFVRGYPGYYNSSCVSNLETASAYTTDDAFDARHLFGAWGEVQSTPAGYVKFNTSSAKGMSGGPHYYCPTGNCADSHYITAVNAYATTWSLGGYTSGPKASSIRAWVLSKI